MNDRSKELFASAVDLIPGGVNSPVRAFRGVGGTPLFIKSASGATVTDVDDRIYIDYVGSWGPMILGHADGEIVTALQQAAARAVLGELDITGHLPISLPGLYARGTGLQLAKR